MPPIFGITNQWVDSICAHANIKDTYCLTTGNGSLIAVGQQIGQIVHVIGTPRNRRAEVIGRNIPMRYAVKALQKSTIQGFDGTRISEVDTLITVRIQENESSQFGRFFDESIKVVTALMAVTRMELSRRFV
ncbi:protein of unknown function [Alcaligenes faecalis subsp. faecalis]|nr:protein of unknown function [Alcaligenes faecalis subsp. faecalis]